MNSSFQLKKPNSKNETLIYFTSYFKYEGKQFKYSTSEKINPKYWDFKNRKAKSIRSNTIKAQILRKTNTQLSRYENLFNEVVANLQLKNETPTISIIKSKFDENFKKSSHKASSFFTVYDKFLDYKKDRRNPDAIADSTAKRYFYNRKLLKDFETKMPYKLSFNNMNESTWNDFINYCIEVKNHSANTLARNLSLLRSFLNWSYLNEYTYNNEFKKFRIVKKFPTQEIALSLEVVKDIAEFDFGNNHRLERVRDLFIWGCATGMRFGNYSEVTKNDIYNGNIHVVDIKDKSKLLEIPITDFALKILEKYDYELPSISNQKFNKYIKEAFKIMGYDELIKKSMKYGKEIIDETKPMYERISSHTARRSFITIMKNHGTPDKIIMSITGHKSLPVLNTYYKPNSKKKEEFIKAIWDDK